MEAPLQFKTQYRVLSMVMLASACITALKFGAFFLTNSTAILTDAFESVVNLVTTGFAIFALYISSRPADEDHPYGHGKVELFSVGFEGGLIFVAGLLIVARAVWTLFFPQPIAHLDLGAWLSVAGGLGNFCLGMILTRYGRRLHSAPMTADGVHYISDTISSAGLVLGLLVIILTGYVALDGILAIIFGSFILWTGFKLAREAVSGLMDKADPKLLEQVVQILNANRRERWIDVHNLRVQRYGSQVHIDCHLTLPWYDDLNKAHEEVKALEKLVNQHMGNRVELFIHADPCRPSACSLCAVSPCPARQAPFEQRVEWSRENLISRTRHQS